MKLFFPDRKVGLALAVSGAGFARCGQACSREPGWWSLWESRRDGMPTGVTWRSEMRPKTMTIGRRIILVLLLGLCGLTLSFRANAQLREVGDGSDRPVRAAHLTAELVSGGMLTPGGSTQIALVLHLDPGWHVYWSNPGDAGEAPQVEWILPAHVTVGPMQFSAPKRLPVGTLTDYGYEGTAVFPFRIRASAAQVSGDKAWLLRAHARWAVCREICVPGRAYLGLLLSPAGPAPSKLVAQAIAQQPQPLPQGARARVTATGDTLTLHVITGAKEQTAEFFPLDSSTIRNTAKQNTVSTSNGIDLALPRDASRLPHRLRGVVELERGRNYSIDAPIEMPSPHSSAR